jgi:hypothetical protein
VAVEVEDKEEEEGEEDMGVLGGEPVTFTSSPVVGLMMGIAEDFFFIAAIGCGTGLEITKGGWVGFMGM